MVGSTSVGADSPPATTPLDDALPAESALHDSDDRALRQRLHALVDQNADFWNFDGSNRRTFAHGYFQYPAMMVPNMVGRALDEVARTRTGPLHLLDPFAGSGTVVTEAIARGWDVTAIDINPLAVLLCKTKAGPKFEKATSVAVNQVLKGCTRPNATDSTSWFPNVRKWFEPSVIACLTSLQAEIRRIPSIHVRRFLWVILAETTRLVSNSRLSTVKLHIRSTTDRSVANPAEVFARIAARNLALLETEVERLRDNCVLKRGWPTSTASVVLGDSSTFDYATLPATANVLVTSPPYGDNHSTISYGQHAFLPLHWIDRHDIDPGANTESVHRPTGIDQASLGGSRRAGAERAAILAKESPCGIRTIESLAGIRRDHANKVGAFLADLHQSLDRSLAALSPGAHMVVTVGDRTVSGVRIPTARVIQDIATHRGASVIAAIPRRLPAGRRMASRNNYAPRMTTEWILVMRMPSWRS